MVTRSKKRTGHTTLFDEVAGHTGGQLVVHRSASGG